MEINEESKHENKGGNMRTGDKYIIRKLVSTKIMPEQIQDFINMVSTSTAEGENNGYGMNYPTPAMNINQINYPNNNFMSVPQPAAHIRSNS